MKFVCTLLSVLFTGAIATASSPGPAPLVGGSDTCTTPDVIAGPGSHNFDTTMSTTGAEGQGYARCYIYNTSGITNDVWFEWTAASTGWVQVNLCQGGFNDTKVAIYAGSGCPTAEPIECDDDGCGAVGSTSRGAFLATSGQVYTIQLGCYPGTAGTLGSFTIDPFTPGAGDDCAAPIVVTGNGPHVWDGSQTTTGTQGQMEALCSSQMITYDSWYTWVSTCTGPVNVSLCSGSIGDTKIAVYAGAGCPTASALACDDDFCGGGAPSQVTFNATAGNAYTIQIGMWPGWVPNSGLFEIQPSCPPAAGTPVCFGDGTGTACPCGNTGAAGHGCASSVSAQGALLGASGTSSLANDTVVLSGSQMPNSFCLYYQGMSQISVAFGDGLRCAGGSIARIGTKSNSGGASQYPGAGDAPVSVRGMVTAPGTRIYQAWYRNAAVFCTSATFNLTNGLSITWF